MSSSDTRRSCARRRRLSSRPSVRRTWRPVASRDVWYAAWKRHYGLYPISAKLMDPYASELGEYEISKGTIRFPIAHPPTPATVKRIVEARLAELQATT